MVTPRTLLVENKKSMDDEYFIALFKRLLFEMLHDENIDLYNNMDKQLDRDFVERYQINKQRLRKHEPLGHVLGYEWFYGLKLKVNQDVLIPRNETEELCGNVSADIFDYFGDNVDVVDIATGSGALACAIKSDYPKANVVACDISEKAIDVAKENAVYHQLDITFLVGDMAEPLIKRQLKFDVVMCNPPYIKNNEEIESSVKDFEPHVALFGGDDGLDLYRRVLDQVPFIVKEKALVAFEIGYDQKQPLLNEINDRFKDATVICKQDVNNKDRMIFIYFNITP